MVTCTNCSKKLDRNVFCDSKCKMRWHRKKEEKPFKVTDEFSDEFNKELDEIKIETCKHGSAKGLCKKGC